MTITFEQIMAIIVAAAPSITAIIGIVVAVVKGIKSTGATGEEIITSFETLRKDVLDTKEYEALKNQLILAYQENRELKKKLNELLTKIDKIDRTED